MLPALKRGGKESLPRTTLEKVIPSGNAGEEAENETALDGGGKKGKRITRAHNTLE